MQGFEYPMEPHHRRHGPAGYTDYESYRPWLRDEFYFRCVYCLLRERWNPDDITFNIDHSHPVAHAPDLRCDYENLLYACSRCNRAKTDILGVPDPCHVAFGECLMIQEAGSIKPFNDRGIKISDTLQLNAPKRIEFRGRWIRMLRCLSREDPMLYREYMGFPSNLDDLRPPKLRPPTNSMPDSVNNCFFVQREQGRLAVTY